MKRKFLRLRTVNGKWLRYLQTVFQKSEVLYCKVCAARAPPLWPFSLGAPSHLKWELLREGAAQETKKSGFLFLGLTGEWWQAFQVYIGLSLRPRCSIYLLIWHTVSARAKGLECLHAWHQSSAAPRAVLVAWSGTYTLQTHITAYGSLMHWGLNFSLSCLSKQFVKMSSSSEFSRNYSSAHPSTRLVGSSNFIRVYLFDFISFSEK